MERTWLRRERVRSDRGSMLELDYYLLTETDGTSDHYGLQITLRDGEHEESAAAADITPVGSRILHLIDRLADGTVTPAGLPDVLPELLG